jgi:hypothetical protein
MLTLQDTETGFYIEGQNLAELLMGLNKSTGASGPGSGMDTFVRNIDLMSGDTLRNTRFSHTTSPRYGRIIWNDIDLTNIASPMKLTNSAIGDCTMLAVQAGVNIATFNPLANIPFITIRDGSSQYPGSGFQITMGQTVMFSLDESDIASQSFLNPMDFSVAFLSPPGVNTIMLHIAFGVLK